MAKPWRRKKPTKGPRGLCDYEEGKTSKCGARARVKHECRSCEALKAQGKREEVFQVQACPIHAVWSWEAIKAHCLTAHPVNMLRGIGAALAGEDVF